MNFDPSNIKVKGKVTKPVNDPANGKFVLDSPDYNGKTEVPNMEFLTSQLVEILSYVNSDSMNEMRKTDKTGFKTHIQNKFHDFSDKYYTLLEMILNDDVNDITPLLKMLSIFSKTTSDKLDSQFETYRESVAEQYLYPSFGGKEQYAKKMKEEEKMAKKKHKK
jgi:hypothetical protein